MGLSMFTLSGKNIVGATSIGCIQTASLLVRTMGSGHIIITAAMR